MSLPEELSMQPEEAPYEPSPTDRLLQFIEMPNIAVEMEGIEASDERNLDNIAQRVVEEYRLDKDSRREWEDRSEAAVELARLASDEKNYPFEGASNVKYPLLTTAALQFNARSYPSIVQGKRVARCVTWGDDPGGEKAARADRVGEHLSYQLLAEMPEWEEDTDKLLLMVSILGCMFRKAWFDPSLGRVVSRLIPPQKLVLNYNARSIEDCPRITEEIELYPHEIQERIRDGRFLEFEYEGQPGNREGAEDEEDPGTDDYAPHIFLEQHRLLDLDGDGYPEPYVVTVHKATQKTARIVACYDADGVMVTENGEIGSVRRNDYFVRYVFFPSPDAGIYGWGFGQLLKDITESINTTLNQMLDAGHLANVQGGLISANLGVREKNIRLEMGQWKVIQTSAPLSQSVYPIRYDGPSPVLFQLLGTLVEAGREVASIKDVLTGEVRQNMTAAATLALIEQGMQVFTAIYKRIFRSLKKELGIYAMLNRKYLDRQRYNTLFDGQEEFDPARDYMEGDMDILPVADPNMSSRMQELAKAQYLREISAENPVINQAAVTHRLLEAGQIDDIEELIQPPEKPDPLVEHLMTRQAQLELDEKEAEIIKKTAQALKDIATADSAEHDRGLRSSDRYLKALQMELDAENTLEERRIRAMESQSRNAMGAGAAGQPR